MTSVYYHSNVKYTETQIQADRQTQTDTDRLTDTLLRTDKRTAQRTCPITCTEDANVSCYKTETISLW